MEDIIMDYTELKEKIRILYKSESNFSDVLGVSKSNTCLKLKNKIQFNQEDIVKYCKLLQIKQKDIPIYFFTQKVEKKETE